MQALAIVVADAARARLFTYKREDDADRGPTLRERVDLVNPAGRMKDGELFSESRPSLTAGPTGRGNALDDHRSAHVGETERRFAQQVMEKTAALVKDTACVRVALVASPRFLGRLREHVSALKGVPVEDFARDLTHEATPKLRDHLASLGVIPQPPR